MSSTQMSNGIATAAPTTTRRTVTSATSYEAAERSVDWLSDQDFPVEHVRIVGTGLRFVEQVSGRLTTGRRDFDSVATTRADRYEVQVDDDFAGEAERLLARMPSR